MDDALINRVQETMETKERAPIAVTALADMIGSPRILLKPRPRVIFCGRDEFRFLPFKKDSLKSQRTAAQMATDPRTAKT